MCKIHIILGISLASQILSGCSSLLPSVKQASGSPWNSYEAVRESFGRILPGTTQTAELNALGFDPFKYPNIKVLNYLEVMRQFLPNESVRITDLPPDVQACLEAKTGCRGYEVSTGNLFRERTGNAFLDVFNFRRKTKTSGWQFTGLIVMNNGRVIYKVEGGRPNILELEDKKNPLGPIQDITIPSQLPLTY